MTQFAIQGLRGSVDFNLADGRYQFSADCTGESLRFQKVDADGSVTDLADAPVIGLGRIALEGRYRVSVDDGDEASVSIRPIGEGE